MSVDLAAVLAELDAHRERFTAFCLALSPEELERPVPGSSWLVRDFIAHLATIDGPVTEIFRSARAGEIRYGGADASPFDVDEWNERQVQARRRWNVRQLLTEAGTERTILREALVALKDADLDHFIPFAGDARRPPAKIELRQYVGGWCKHDPMHVVDMIRALPERRTPTVAAWLDDPAVQRYQAMMNPE
ncbi:MAG: DinB family protein [Dehalococcoidia bacterium]|nr:DinB family protein [Dehalococcoidia bacterium]